MAGVESFLFRGRRCELSSMGMEGQYSVRRRALGAQWSPAI